MNLPNLITLSRIPTMFIIVALMYCSWWGAATLAFWLFIASAIGDWLDGYLARKRNLVSVFGKFMDALTDKVFVVGIMVAFVERLAAQYPNGYGSVIFLVMVLLTLCREFLISGMRMIAATQGVVVAAERGGKIKTVMQLIAVGFLLFVPALENDWARYLPFSITEYAGLLHKTGIGIFIVATVLTVSSGVSYASKYRRMFGDIAK
ncbi:MAG: CDP-diacylglycerol--glycerol-3-phosphate 3-phosphatidyltransferase [Verrucomicrobia bacterium]|nr:CDP-diacylglycerol--glycerol-3-phosphate 3-phosphatidyltransferase [Verrucomicrobiota bacterium]